MVFSNNFWTRNALQFLMLLLDAVLPLSAAYLVHHFTFPPDSGATHFIKDIAIPSWCAIEVLLYLYFKRELKRIQTPNAVPMSKYARKILFAKITSEVDMIGFLMGWFSICGDNTQLKRSDMHLLRRENIKEWISWAFFSGTLEQTLDNHFRELEAMTVKAEKLCGHSFPSGYNSGIYTIRLGFNRVHAYHKPFVLYATIFCLETFGAFVYFCMGFKHSFSHDFSYYHKTSMSGKTPIVFFHGIGGGLFCYIKLISKLIAMDSDRSIFLVEIPHVSMKMIGGNAMVPGMAETVKSVEEMIQRYKFRTAHFIGHSLGTVYVSWLVKYSSLVSSSHFIDPICFKLYQPDITFNFVHRQPNTATELLVHWLVSREIYISHYISRHFIWHHNVLFPTDLLLDNSRVYIALDDNLIDAPTIWRYLQTHRVKGRAYANLDHAGFLLDNLVEDAIVLDIGKCIANIRDCKALALKTLSAKTLACDERDVGLSLRIVESEIAWGDLTRSIIELSVF